jgi:serine/threonine-protein kinase
MNDIEKSLLLITNSENQSFGTGFVIYKERNYSYILTCSHVVEDVPKSLKVDSVDAKIVYKGSSDGLDLAIIKAQIDKPSLQLMESSCDEFEISGFKSFRNNDHILEPINCTLDTKIEFRPQSGETVNGWKLNIDESDIIVGGYSGSPLICKESGKVVAVVSNRQGGRDGFAISIENLKTIWKNMPRNLVRKEGYVPKIFISTAHREPDISIASEFAKELNALGYRTFLAKTDIPMGKDWLSEIHNELEACDYLLLLLSKNSLASEMVLEEVQKIKELQRGSDFPAILPVRINLPFDYNINYALLKQIDKIQQLVWESKQDTKKIVKKISIVMSQGGFLEPSTESLPLIETDIPVPNAPLEQPTGTVPLDSHYYITRSDDERCYQNLSEKYSLIRIKAPRQYGKTSLLARLILKAKELEYYVVPFNFQEFDKPLLNDLDELLEFICEMVAFELDIEVNINPRILKRLTPKTKATKYMQKILEKLDKPLVLAIDEADKLFDYAEVSDEFFGLIRAWHEKSKSDPLWEKLKILLSHSTEPLLGITSINQSPFHNVGLGIELKPFTRKELKELSTRHGLTLKDDELDGFENFIGGHPYLSRKVLYAMVNDNESFSNIRENADTDKSIFNDHMRRYLWILRDNERLTEILQAILKGNHCDDDTSCYILEATGLIKNTMNKPQFSCELYQEFFSKKL